MGIKEGISEIWEDLMSYRTLKVVKISDKRLAYVHKTLMASILVYSTISMIGGHTYMMKEKPRMYVATSLDDTARLTNFSAELHDYCNQTLTDFVGDAFVSEGVYVNNSCATFLTTSQVSRVDEQGAFIGTHLRQRSWTRTCEDEDAKVGCVVTNDGGDKNYFPAGMENLNVQFRATYVTSWGVSEPPKVIFVKYEGGDYSNFDVTNSDTSKRFPTFTLSELVGLADASLDERNEVTVSTNFTGRYPLYRITGLRLNVEFTFSNFRGMSAADPFNFQSRANMKVVANSKGLFVGSQDTTFYTGAAGAYDTTGTLVSIRGVTIEFQAKGLMGKADGYTGMMALMSCLVMVGVATSIVDVIGAFVYESFKDDKIEDDGERQHLEHMILNIETTGVPFKHDDLQVLPNVSVKDFLQMLQKDILKLSTLAHHMSRDLSSAGLNRHTMEIAQIDTSAATAARYRCALVGPDKKEIFLTGGPQTLGRGHGGATSKRISHKQLSIVANTHTGVALIRGLHTKNCSGIALGGGPWQPLTMDDEVELMNGDMVSLLLDEGVEEEETSVEGVFVYTSSRVQEKKDGWFNWW